MRNGRSRKEVWFTSEERAMIKITAARFHIDETSMVRVLLQLGFESLPGNAYNVGNNVTPTTNAAIKPGYIKE